MRAYYFDAAGNHVAIGFVRSTGMTPDEAFGILRGADCTPLAEHRADNYCVLSREHHQLRARFWNPDGTREDICGNALRCVPILMADLGEPHERATVNTGIGPVTVLHLGPGMGGAEISTRDFSVVDLADGADVMVNVGTPHRVRFVDDLSDPGLVALGQRWAHAEIPVAATFVKVEGQYLSVRSFERGVLRETGSSGTAALAAFLADARRAPDANREYGEVCFPGDRRLRVRLDRERGTVTLYGAVRLEFGCDLVTDGERLASSG